MPSPTGSSAGFLIEDMYGRGSRSVQSRQSEMRRWESACTTAGLYGNQEASPAHLA